MSTVGDRSSITISRKIKRLLLVAVVLLLVMIGKTCGGSEAITSTTIG